MTKVSVARREATEMKRVVEFAVCFAFICALAIVQRLKRTRWVETRG